MIGVPEEDIIKEAESLRDKNAQELWMRNGKWVDGAEFLRWATKAVKDAASIEDILLINRPTYMYVEAYITVWPPRGVKGWSRNILRRPSEPPKSWIPGFCRRDPLFKMQKKTDRRLTPLFGTAKRNSSRPQSCQMKFS